MKPIFVAYMVVIWLGLAYFMAVAVRHG